MPLSCRNVAVYVYQLCACIYTHFVVTRKVSFSFGSSNASKITFKPPNLETKLSYWPYFPSAPITLLPPYLLVIFDHIKPVLATVFPILSLKMSTIFYLQVLICPCTPPSIISGNAFLLIIYLSLSNSVKRILCYIAATMPSLTCSAPN